MKPAAARVSAKNRRQVGAARAGRCGAPTRTDYEFRGWSCSGKPVFSGTTYAELAGDKSVQSITLTAQWAAAWYPEGEIKIEGEDTVWNGFESDYSARFYNTEQTVTISAPKSGGKRWRLAI